MCRAARGAIKAFGRKAIKIGDRARTDEDLHMLRIALKRLRYGVEFLRGLAPKRMGRLAEMAAVYQDILGRHNDAIVACGRVREAAKALKGDRWNFILLGYLLACQRLAAMDAKGEFLAEWGGRKGKRLANALTKALARL